ncbi:MAG: YraN family protein [Oscillospiraceae bacterium]
MKLSESKKLRGHWGEQQAAAYLKRRGYRILGQNYTCRFGEIDVIAADRKYVAFVEVKLRSTDRFAQAREYVGAAKQERIRTAAALWLSENETALQPRFDVIEIYGNETMNPKQLDIRHIENAFE